MVSKYPWALAYAMFAIVLPAALSAQALTTVVPTAGASPVAVVVNTTTNKIYVGNLSDRTVTVIDGATNAATNLLAGAPGYGGIAVNSATNKIYVSDGLNNSVTVIDGATNSMTPVATDPGPNVVLVNPGTNKIYVLCAGTVSVIDGATSVKTASISLGANPSANMALNAVTNKLYVSSNTGNVTVIDLATNGTTVLPMGTNLGAIAVNPITNKIYVTNAPGTSVSSDSVVVIDGATNASAPVTVAPGPVCVGVNTATNKIYVAANGLPLYGGSSQPQYGNHLTVIDGATNSATTFLLPAADVRAGCVAVNEAVNKIYVSGRNTGSLFAGVVTTIDGATNALTMASLADSPAGFAINPSTNKVYVADATKNRVLIIDGAGSGGVGLSPIYSRTDLVTHGTWSPTYGSDGYIIPNGTNAAPSYATVSFPGASAYTWLASTTDSRTLLKNPSTTDRIASTYYAGDNFTIDLTLTGGVHQVALYLLDFDSTSRAESISILNPNSGNAVLGSLNFSSFNNGAYVVLALQGHVLIKVTRTGGLNAVVSGIFFDPAFGQVSVTSPKPGSVNGTANMKAATPLPASFFSKVQFQVDGANQGAPATIAPFSVSWDTFTATNGPHTVSAIATDLVGQTLSSSVVAVDVANGSAPPGGGGSGNPWITAFSSGSPRNDFSGFVGVSLKVGSADLSVQALGRVCLGGNAGTHTVKLVSAASAIDVAGASASINMAGCTPGQFVYSSLPGAITLTKNLGYYLVSNETAGGDTWYDLNGTITVASDASVNGPVYSFSGAWYSNGSGSRSYVPANFQYSISGGGSSVPPTVNVTSPSSGATVSGQVTVTATAGATSPAAVSSVQFLLDGSNLGSQVTTAPYSVSWDTTGASNGSHTLTASVKDSLAQTVTSGPISVLVNNSAPGGGSPSGGALVTGFTSTNPRKDFSGWVGMYFTVKPSETLVVSALGRVCASGNTATHVVKLVNSATGQDVPAGSASVPMGGCTPGQFVYTNLPNAIQLPPSSGYYLVSQETSGGDFWYDATAVNAPGVTVSSSVYSWNGTWARNNDGARSYVPTNLKFGVAGSANTPPTVNITNPALGVTVSSMFAVTSTAAASAPATVASVTYYLDGVSLGVGSGVPAFTFNWDSTATTDGAHTLTAIALDSAGLKTISAPVSFTVSNSSSGGGTPFITTFGFYNPRLRNDFTGFAGTQLTVPGSTPLTVSYVGRGCAAGNSGIHTVKFVFASSGLDVPGGSAQVNMTGCAAGQFSWSALAAPISLTPGVAYYLVSQEFNNGDAWYEKAPVTTESFASIISAVYLQDNGVWHPIAPPNYAYVPPNFK